MKRIFFSFFVIVGMNVMVIIRFWSVLPFCSSFTRNYKCFPRLPPPNISSNIKGKYCTICILSPTLYFNPSIPFFLLWRKLSPLYEHYIDLRTYRFLQICHSYVRIYLRFLLLTLSHYKRIKAHNRKHIWCEYLSCFPYIPYNRFERLIKCLCLFNKNISFNANRRAHAEY